MTLIKNALQSIPVNTMATISPPNTTIKYIESLIADFFWEVSLGVLRYLSLPCSEGGVG